MSPTLRTRLASAPAPREVAPPPGLLLSSRSRQWSGIVADLHRFHDVDVLCPVREHIIGVHLAGAVNLLQSRGGHTWVKHVRAGDVTITPCGEPKRFQHAGEAVVLLLRLDPAYVQQVAGDEYALDPARFELRESLGVPDPELAAIGRQMLAALESEGMPGRAHAESLTTELAIHLIRQYNVAPLHERRPASRLATRKLQRVLDYIDTNLRHAIALADLAGLVAISPGHFAHLFRQTTGLPPHRFILERRVDRAKALLRDTDLPITQIAEQVGCASHSHLSVVFHRETGVTPRDFRRQA